MENKEDEIAVLINQMRTRTKEISKDLIWDTIKNDGFHMYWDSFDYELHLNMKNKGKSVEIWIYKTANEKEYGVMIGHEPDDEETFEIFCASVMFSNFASCHSFADLLSNITGFEYVGLQDCNYKKRQ